MYSTRAFHVFSRFPTRAVAVILLPAVLVFMALGCGGGEPAPPGGDATPESTAESRPREREPGSGSAGGNTPEPTAQAASQQQSAGAATPGPARTEQPAPTATAVSTPLAPAPTVPAETATPVPEGPPTPTPDAAWLLPATLRTPSPDAPTPPSGVYPTREDLQASLTFSFPGCVEDFWQMLLNWPSDPAKFDYGTAQSVNEKFIERRTDCVAQGWNPQFSEHVVCQIEPSQATGLHLPAAFTTVTERGKAIMHPTSGAQDGSLLIHLSAMPFDSGSDGCWYYSAEPLKWAWLSQPVTESYEALNFSVMDRGNVLFGFEPCNSLVKILSERALSYEPAESLTASYFSTLVTRVHEFAPDFCGQVLDRRSKPWHPVATTGPSGDCSVEAETGPLPGGGLVINWDPGSKGLGFASTCWVLSPDGEWSP